MRKKIVSHLPGFTNYTLRNEGDEERLSLIGPSFIASLKIALKREFVPLYMADIYGYKRYKAAIIWDTENSKRLRKWIKSFSM